MRNPEKGEREERGERGIKASELRNQQTTRSEKEPNYTPEKGCHKTTLFLAIRRKHSMFILFDIKIHSYQKKKKIHNHQKKKRYVVITLP